MRDFGFFDDNKDMSGSSFVTRVQSELEKLGKYQKDVADACGFHASDFAKWKSVGNYPNADVAIKIADYLHVRLYWLIKGVDEDKLTDDQRDLIEKYRQLGEGDRRVARDLIQSLLREADAESKMPSGTTFIRIVEPDTEGALSIASAHIEENVKIVDRGYVYISLRGKTAAGRPIDITEEPLARVLFPKALITGDPDDYFCLEVSGTSMTEVGINDGDMVLIKSTNVPEFGKIMLVRYENTSTLKRVVKKNGNIYLCWEDGSGTEVQVDSDSYAVEGLLVRISKLPE